MRIQSRSLAALTVAAIMLLGVLAARAEDKPADAPKPNILLIVADDLGYGSIGVQGCTDIPTPNIDALAASGVRFTNAYVTCPVCAPTRAGLMTGRYQQRFGFEHNPGPPGMASADFGLPRDQKTLAEKLKAAGYATAMFGKWHLGFNEGLRPPERGFDEYYGFLAGAHNYLPGRRDKANPILRGLKPTEEPDYLTDQLARETVDFIGRKKAGPWFVYLPFNAVHAPLQGRADLLQRFASIADPKRRTFAAMLTAMDEAIGKVLAKLKEEGLDEKTLVLFLSDNGGPTAQTTSENKPLRGFKGQVLEGGIRIPYMARWTGHWPAGKVIDTPVVSMDLHATALAAAGIKPGAGAPIDGRDIMPLILKGEKPERDSLCWRFGQQAAIRVGDWKLVMIGREAPELYNLAEDIGEARDLSAKNPEKAAELKAAWEKWNAQMIAPRWKRAQGPDDEGDKADGPRRAGAGQRRGARKAKRGGA